MRHWLVGGALALGLACASGEAPAPAPTDGAPTSTDAAAPEPAGKAKGKRKAKAKHGSDVEVPATGIPDPLAGLTDRELCAGTPAQLMLKYELGALQNGKCHDVCCPIDSRHWCCELDFPFSDVPPCDAWASMRNEIFARYGYPFKEQRWRDEFEQEPWYRRREDFDAKWLSPMASRNVETLKENEDKKIGCMDP